MKITGKYLITIALLLIVMISTAIAQKEKSTIGKVERDMEIMKTILAELFQMENSPEVKFQIHGRNISKDDISGFYQPGYGIILSVPDRLSRRILVVTTGDEERANLYFKHRSSGDESTVKADEKGIETKIRDFLRVYTSSVTYLPENERILVIFGDTPLVREGPSSYSILGNATTIINSPLPKMAFSVDIKDITDFNRGRISEQEFNRKIRPENLFNEKEKPLDLAIFANILKSAFDESDSNKLKIRRTPDPLYLSGFGVIYRAELAPERFNIVARFNVDRMPEIRMNLDTIRIDFDRSRFNLDSLRIQMDSVRVNT
ncbi:MAG: hypothetical protein ACFCU6_11345, partial [Balneolaceae bacterium]